MSVGQVNSLGAERAPAERAAALPAVVVLAAAGVVAGLIVAVAFWLGPIRMTSRQWLITGELAAAGVAAHLLVWRFSGRGRPFSPRWDVHTAWLLPGAILLPPLGLACLAAAAITLAVARTTQRAGWRWAFCVTCVAAAFAAHLAARLSDTLLLGGLLAIGATMLVGLAIGLPTTGRVDRLAAKALWLDARWGVVQVGAALTGLVVAAAAALDPWFASVALAPAAFVAFAVRWPELDRTARSDTKTRLSNAAHWETVSRLMFRAAEPYRSHAAIVMIDLDDFKAVNDTYGHLVGDEVLATCADVLRSLGTTTDALGRFGGEEFVVSVVDRDDAAVADLAEVIRQNLAAVDYRASRLSDGENSIFRVTCTVGFATATDYGYHFDRLLHAADAAMVKGKRDGRNRVVRL